MPCPSCGAELLDCRNAGLDVIKAARQGLCIRFSESDYQCAKRQRERDSLNPRQLRDAANTPWREE